MPNLVPDAPLATASFTTKQIQIIKQTVAKDTNGDEFDLFMETARMLGLNPFKRQVGARVYNKNDAKRRSMAIITEIGGFRAIAARQKDYRPDDKEPDYIYNDDLKSVANPLGIERCTVRAYKLDPNNEWQTVVGVAYWDEFAPIKEDCPDGWSWEETGEVWEDSGKPKNRRVPKGELVPMLDQSGNWPRMPRHMIAKCAEAVALRKGWPEDFSGLYEEAEFDKADLIEATATEVFEQAQADDRMKRIGATKTDLVLQWDLGDPLEAVPMGDVFDRVAAYAQKAGNLVALKDWRSRNQASLQRFWAEQKADALDLKKLLDKREAELAAALESADA